MKFILIGIVFIIPSILERIYIQGPHFGGVYGILIGGFLLLKGCHDLKKKHERETNKTIKSQDELDYPKK